MDMLVLLGISWINQIRAVVTMKLMVVASALVAAISADADPQLLYGGYGYAGLAGYAGYPYALGYGLGLKTAPCVNAANVPVPCAAGKRKRDADADPALLYGGYGYGYAGYPYAYGITHPSNLGLCVNYLGAQVPC